MSHRLDPLLRPRSVAVIGASRRADTMGDWALRNLERAGFEGRIYPVNPGYDDVRGRPCFASITELPEVPDLAIFAVGDHRLESTVDEVITKGIPAAVIHSSLYLDDDKDPPLKERLRAKFAAAGTLVCGGNGMGFYNIRDKVWGCGFDSRKHPPDGNATLISQSGCGMSGIIDMESRLRANLAVSTGNELSVTVDEYIDFALDLPETRVIGLFIETAINPGRFRAALRKAAAKKVPIVAIKVGKTRKSAELAISHSGTMAGDDATYEALFDRYGVHRVDDQDEMASTMILFAEMNPIGPGDLVSMHDSGGQQQLTVDLAEQAGVPMAELSAETVAKLEAVLDPELPAVNPLDVWSRGGDDWTERMTQMLTILMQDEGAALGALIHDRGPDGRLYPQYDGYMRSAREASRKSVALVGSRQGPIGDPLTVELTRDGMPVLDGVLTFLKGVRGLMDYRDFQALSPMVI
ncbi:MAG: CoA-binding protein, partial [Woeseiaceae bacterium]|nr:CoA-binding protein [Woeseiaceae bacterium]